MYTALSSQFGTYYVNDFNLQGRVFRVMMSADEQYRETIDSIDKVYVKTMERSIKHFKDEFGNHWYDYRDLCGEVLIPDRERNYIFYNWVNEDERTEVRLECSLVKYVSAEGFKRIIERNYQRGMWIYNDLVNSEFEEPEYKKLNNKLKDLSNLLDNKGNVTDIVNTFNNIYQDKDCNIDNIVLFCEFCLVFYD